MRAALLVLASLSLTFAAAPAGAAPGPAAFLQGLYAHYAESSSFSALDDAPSWFSPALLKLIRADTAAAGGEVGNLDVDPVCDCQDYGDFKVLSIVVDRQAAGAAQATVRFTNFGDTDTMTVSLVPFQGGWRIDDLSDADMPSLRKLLVAPE